eukprot:CAMPEP_0194038232 /NCGR_PEP_ID=MMETSP0009_2-20130614/10484_1 /TAXON_ID=210454 /ORGANISM="Grammatophora oceanica, Strain CCMP 410" /LENGTH=1201 /DNA_ID=CAMNT_0038680669 /DNA_START=46 /DNA_END=3651 /DNA_ORIENTATION=-
MLPPEQDFDLENKLKERLETTKKQKEKQLAASTQLNKELQELFSKIPKKPREAMEVLDEKIKKLEHKRTITSIPLQEEKKILYEIQAVEKVKKQLLEYNAMESKIQDKKKQQNDTWDSVKANNATIDELESVLSKVRLANKLGCKPAELQNISMDCPSDKVGRIIGRGGATIKQIETKCKVSMNVDNVMSKIHLTGTEAGMACAISEIDKIVLAVDEEVTDAPEDLLTYLTTRRVHALEVFRAEHASVQMEVLLKKKMVALRGPPTEVSYCKEKLLGMTLTKAKKEMKSKETGLVVGKGGTAINKIIDTHQVAIDVSETGEDEYTAIVLGPPANVEAAMNEMNSLLDDNADVVETMTIPSMFRNILLMDSGEPIRKLQSEVNEKVREEMGGGYVLINVQRETTEDGTVLNIKGRKVSVICAMPVIEEALDAMKEKMIIIKIDPFVSSRIIGKGGETIKKLRRKGVNIEVEKDIVCIHASDAEQGKEVEQEVQAIIAENQILRMDFDPASIKPMFREIIRHEQKDKINELVWMTLDDDTFKIILRGPQEKIDEAKAIIESIMETNFVHQIEISADDEAPLLAGGQTSALKKFEDELGVSLFLVRNKYVLEVKGERPKVEAAVKRIKQFIHGGDGYTVASIGVSKQAMGVVIGKGGSKRAELEEQFQDVSIFTGSNASRIVVRGPEEQVKACRVEILKLVSSVRIVETMELTEAERKKLSQDVVRKVTMGIPVIVKLNDSGLTIRGVMSDVRDAQVHLNEKVKGYYEATVELEPTQLASVRGACRDPSHFKRIEETSKAKINLDIGASAIRITGKRAAVKQAKLLIVGFLEFLLPSDFARLAIAKPLQSTVADAGSLGDVSATSGANVTLDRDLNMIQIQSSDPEKVKAAVAMMKPKVEEAQRLAFSMTLTPSEDFIIPMLIGKGGTRVNSLRVETGCTIDINKEDRTITCVGQTEDDTAKARDILTGIVDTARRECLFVDIPINAVAPFLGRQGAHIKKFSQLHGVEVERMRKTPSKLKITGKEMSVQSAKKALDEWIRSYQEQNAEKVMTVDPKSFPAIIGRQGSTISALTKEFNVKIDTNREAGTVTIRGGTEENRDKASEKIAVIVSEDKAAFMSRRSSSYDDEEDNPAKSESSANKQKQSPQQKQPKGMPAIESKKDRRGEFAKVPVGMSSAETKPKRKRRNKKPVMSTGAKVGAVVG